MNPPSLSMSFCDCCDWARPMFLATETRNTSVDLARRLLYYYGQLCSALDSRELVEPVSMDKRVCEDKPKGKE
jgi:hypothetical protein